MVNVYQYRIRLSLIAPAALRILCLDEEIGERNGRLLRLLIACQQVVERRSQAALPAAHVAEPVLMAAQLELEELLREAEVLLDTGCLIQPAHELQRQADFPVGLLRLARVNALGPGVVAGDELSVARGLKIELVLLRLLVQDADCPLGGLLRHIQPSEVDRAHTGPTG